MKKSESPREPEVGEPARARAVFERGYKDLKGKGLKHEVCECGFLSLCYVEEVWRADRGWTL